MNYLIGSSYNNAVCQNYCGLCLINGIGTEKDTIKAFEYFEKSANNGYVYGQLNLASAYKYGEGVSKDLPKAFYWFKKAAEQNNTSALNSLAYCYALGEGTPVNFEIALSTIEYAISLSPDDSNLYDSKGEILWLKGSKKAAKKMWEKVNLIDSQYYKENDTELNKYITGNQ